MTLSVLLQIIKEKLTQMEVEKAAGDFYPTWLYDMPVALCKEILEEYEKRKPEADLHIYDTYDPNLVEVNEGREEDNKKK